MDTNVVGERTARDPVRASNSPSQPQALGVLGLLRWGWRQLTSMRTALILLFLLALAAVPGSVFPQRGVSPLRAQQYLQEHATIGPWLDRLGLFDVYATSWFAAIYLLLMVSLVGCVVPRCAQYVRHIRALPPPTPRNLARMPQYRTFMVDTEPLEFIGRARAVCQARRFRVRDAGDGALDIAAEKGFLHEVGNLVFHLSLLVLLLGVGWGSWFGYRGTVIVVEGEGFSNTLTQYDDFSPGRSFSDGRLVPFSFTLNSFDATFLTDGPRRGQPDSFQANLMYRTSLDAAPEPATIRVNHPLDFSGTKVYLLGSGYAPVFTVRDGRNTVVFSGPVAALPQDPSFTSTTAVKAPEANPDQLGFKVTMTPTAPEVVDPLTGPVSAFPEADDPRVYLGGWAGDLGMNSGVPQNIYQLDTSNLKRLGHMSLGVGQTWRLRGGRGSITFDRLAEFANLQVASDPGRWVVLWAVLAGLLGVSTSLLVHRRRVWVRLSPTGDRSALVEVAGLAKVEWTGLAAEVDALVEQLSDQPQPAREVR